MTHMSTRQGENSAWLQRCRSCFASHLAANPIDPESEWWFSWSASQT